MGVFPCFHVSVFPCFHVSVFPCFRGEGDEDETPEGKAERERLRRQANNARERFASHFPEFL